MAKITKQQKIIEALTLAGDTGIHSYQMRQIGGLQAPVRIMELKEMGYNITSHPEKMGNTTGCRYFLNKVISQIQNKIIGYQFDDTANMAIPIYG